MTTKVFLSLSYVDRDFVAQVRGRLPAGLAYFYETSFENGESLITAMERAVKDSAIFVLFASQSGQSSPWVRFELDQARLAHIGNPQHRILVFPTDPNLKLSDLPEWLRRNWVTRAGWAPSDIARYITGVLLEPNSNFSAGAARIIGRGQTLDKLERITAEHIARTKNSPNVYFLSGFRGIGRRTFASYYMRNALSADVNLPYGPTLPLSPQADLVDLLQALRAEISPTLAQDLILRERHLFQELPLSEQIQETLRLLSHFGRLGQAITIISVAGFFEDSGEPKEWLLPFLSAVPKEIILFVVSNRQIQPTLIMDSANIVQMRVDELHDKDIRALMIFTAGRIRLENFTISKELVRAIGGHADVANAAVHLAAVKGAHILERDPRQLFNIQSTILGESVEPAALNDTEREILCMLGWVPKLNGHLLETVMGEFGISADDFLLAIERLVLGCLVVPSGAEYAISPAIRMLFRRFNVTPPELLLGFSRVLSAEWRRAEQEGQFRADLFEAFVFMHSLEGSALPRELRPLLTPGMLYDVIRETYVRGKDQADSELLEQVIYWGELAAEIKMSEATREEIFLTIVLAKIRLSKFGDAEATIEDMAARRYRSVPFLRGHMYRRQEKYPRAIEMLVEAVRTKKSQRSAVHELALAYKKSNRLVELRALSRKHGDLMRDSAMFADFQIGVDLARGDLPAAETGIANLRRMPDDDGRSDIRFAQLLMRRQQYGLAKRELDRLVRGNQGNSLRVRSIRAICAARDGDFTLARKDIEFVTKFPGWEVAGTRLEANLLIEEGRPKEAMALLDGLGSMGPEDRLLYSRALEMEAESPQTTLDERQKYKQQATEIRREYNFALEYDFAE